MEGRYDVLVIGGGSGGCAFARRSATHGVKVALVECARLGGTCVNVGCVPKKIMWWASQVNDFVKEAHEYGFDVKNTGFNWKLLKSKRDASVARLNHIYDRNLADSGVTCLTGYAQFAATPGKLIGNDPWTIDVISPEGKKTQVHAEHVIIATGSQSARLNVPGEDKYTVGSDGFFDLEELPKRVAVIGAGYIAVEFSGVLQGLGAQVDLFIRGETVLRKFDHLISNKVTENLEKQGVTIHRNSKIQSFNERPEGRFVIFEDGQASGPFESIIVAVGREPNLGRLNLDALSPALKLKNGAVEVDAFQNTNLPRIYAIGDVIRKVELTPMAIAAGRRLADRLFLKGHGCARANYENVPSVIFSHPPVGSVGLSEKEAREQYEKVLIYENTAINLYYNVFSVAPQDKPRTHIKLVCGLQPKGGEEIVVGIHMIGMGSDEAIQGFGQAVGRTKAELDSIVAVHPSAAEEIVTCPPWGLPHPLNDVLRPLVTSVGDTEADDACDE